MKLILTIALSALSATTFVAAAPAPIAAPAPAPLKLPGGGHGSKDTYADDYNMGPTDDGNSDLFKHDTLQHAADNNQPDKNNIIGDSDMDDIHDLNDFKKMQNMDGKQQKGKVNLSIAGQRVPLPGLGGRGRSRRSSKLSRRDGVTSLLPGLAPVSMAGSGVGQVFGKIGSFGTALTDKGE